jgi:glycosyltransferase involved in cell wall biosynthesis
MKVAQALMQLGYDIRMFAPAETELTNYQLLLTHYGLRIAPDLELLPSISGLKRLDFIIHAQRAAKRFGADLIYTWLPQSAALGAWTGYPVVLEMHADNSGKLGVWWMRQFWKQKTPKVMTVTTSALRKALERSTKFQFKDEALLLAPNGVELEKYAGLLSPVEARRQLNLREGLTVGFTGHIYPGRGADLLFKLAKQMPAVNFLWVGGTPELVSFWHEKLNEAKMTNVTMTGFMKHESIPLYQAAADVLLMPYSRSIEASSGQDIAEVINPMKMFEYMAAGRGIVSADLPSIREVLNEGNAVLVEPAGRVVARDIRATYRDHVGEPALSNVEVWKVEIEKLLADEPRRLALGRQARKDVELLTWVKREERVMTAIISKIKS